MSYENTGLGADEKVSSLFQPDTVLPAQYLETFRRKAHLEPEKRLMLAVLEDAVACYQKHAGARDARGKAIFRDAEEWITEDNAEWPFSFDNICEILGFDPPYLRQGLLGWKEKNLGPRAKIYRLTPKRQKHKGGAAATGRGQRWLKAMGR